MSMKNKSYSPKGCLTVLTVLQRSGLAALCAVLLVSCKDFFENAAPSAESSDKVFSNVAMIEQAMCGAYQELAQDKGYINRLGCGHAGLNTDCEWSTWSTKSSASAELVTYAQTISNSDIMNVRGADCWSYLNTVIERCNNIIEGIQQYGDTSDAAFRYYLGEAYFLRSFAYLEMVKYWGDVPARFESVTKVHASVNAKKTDRNSIYDHLRVDLREAARLMPWSNDAATPANSRNNVGRGNKAAALALLARADLMYAGKAVRPHTLDDPTGYSVRYNFEDESLRTEIYKEIVWACHQIIQHEDKLAPSFETPFRQICEDKMDYDQMEHLWVLPFADGARGQIMGYNAPKLGSSDKIGGLLRGFGVGGKTNGHSCMAPYLFFQYDNGDTRRDVTCTQGTWDIYSGTDRERLFPGSGEDDVIVYQKAQGIHNFYLSKFRFEWMRPGRERTGDDGIDFPVLRYADVLLMYAEAALYTSAADKVNGLAYLNKVRTRAGIATLGSYDLQTIQTERAKEFCGEYIRKWDLMRWGILKQQVLRAADFAHHVEFVLTGEEGNYKVDHLTTDFNESEVTLYNSYCYKYTLNTELNVWKLDGIYGLNKGETGRPAEYDKNAGWNEKSDLYGKLDKKTGTLTKVYVDELNYPVYSKAEQLESRQYWPIFPHYISASNGNLWNNYGY